MQILNRLWAILAGNNLWLLAVVVLAAAFRVWLSSTHDYLHEWDERYHALVAKNLLLHPLKPTLYETPLTDYDFREWAYNHIWLSKPPLPLWMMALSLKCWGLTEWAVRFPSILFSLGSVFLTYKIGQHLFDRKVGLWAAFFHAIHGLSLEVAAGRYSSDHVETMFLFCMSLGMWAMLRYFNQNSAIAYRKYAFLLGIVTGLAFMCKWTAVLMLPVLWAALVFCMGKKMLWQGLKDSFFYALGLTLTAAPWLIFIVARYPQEANFILHGMFSPVQDVIQGHSGAWYFYVAETRIMFGELVYLPMLWICWLAMKRRRLGRSVLFCWVFIPIILLSMAATKRPNYLLVAAPAFFLLTALFMRLIKQKYQQFNLGRLVWLALLLLPIRYSIERTKVFSNGETSPIWATALKELANRKDLDPGKTLIFNDQHYIEAMFYTGCTAYSWIPIEKVRELKAAGWQILEPKDGKYVPW